MTYSSSSYDSTPWKSNQIRLPHKDLSWFLMIALYGIMYSIISLLIDFQIVVNSKFFLHYKLCVVKLLYNYSHIVSNMFLQNRYLEISSISLSQCFPSVMVHYFIGLIKKAGVSLLPRDSDLLGVRGVTGVYMLASPQVILTIALPSFKKLLHTCLC